METNVFKIDFFVAINEELEISNKFIVSDGKKLFLLRSVEDLPALLRRGWLVHVHPLASITEEIEEPSVYGIELVFRRDLLLQPVDALEEAVSQKDFVLDGKKIGERIRGIRLENNRSQDLFLSGIDQETVQRWEEGKEIPPVDVCMLLSRLANISLEAFLYGKDRLG